MEYNNEHNANNINLDEQEFFSRVQPSYNKSKEDIWNDINSKIDLKQDDNLVAENSVSLNNRIFFGIAASLILLLGTVFLLRYYSQSNYCPEGKQLTVKLPDGSEVTLKSHTAITYYPFWWNFSRIVNLSGEAYFDVKKGKDFVVASSLGKTVVLGTTFNIYARENEYKVTCFTGMVKVISQRERSVLLNPNYTAEVVYNGDIKVSKYDPTNEILDEENKMFDFKSTPLTKVIKEIENYYNIKITSSAALNYNYTGFFSKQKSVNEVLYLICKPYDLTFIALSDTKYHILEN